MGWANMLATAVLICLYFYCCSNKLWLLVPLWRVCVTTATLTCLYYHNCSNMLVYHRIWLGTRVLPDMLCYRCSSQESRPVLEHGLCYYCCSNSACTLTRLYSTLLTKWHPRWVNFTTKRSMNYYTVHLQYNQYVESPSPVLLVSSPISPLS